MFLVVATSCLPQQRPPVDGGSIEINGAEIYWDKADFPLWVLVDDQMPETHIQATFEAANEWNMVVGAQVFRTLRYDHSRPAPRTYGFIAVSMKDLGKTPHNTRKLGVARAILHENSTRMRASQVWFDLDLDESILLTVMIHELGHALTLDHDDDCTSIMHPTVVTCPSPGIKDDDVNRIRDMMSGTRVIVYPEDMEFLPEVWRSDECIHP